MLSSHLAALHSHPVLPHRYLIRSDPLAHVPEELPIHSSSLRERHESCTDGKEDTQL